MSEDRARHRVESERGTRSARARLRTSTLLGRGARATVPIVLAGAMALSLTGPVDAASAAPKRPAKQKTDTSALLRSQLAAIANSTAAPARYTVASGDTVSGIATRFGVSTASVLALNGLGWKSLIFPGQVLTLSGAAVSAPPPTSRGGHYTIVKGDSVSRIAGRFGLTTAALLSANGLGWSSIIYPGQTLTIPAGGSSLPIETVSSVTPVGDPPSTPVVNTPAPVINNSYTITHGDTVSSIARRFGVSMSAILSANGLNLSSIIYAGRTLVIPGVVSAQDGTTVTPLTAEMAANARIIVQIGHELGVPNRGVVIALAAAMQESSLRNVGYGDRDSVGVFQQRTSTGWGPVASLLDVAHASRLFYGGPSNPNRGNTRGLLDIVGWQSMTVSQAAQKVQISAFPDAYAKWEKSATAWLAQLG
jgi:N-acetylmuramoyl-L-alanine amidase